MKIFVNILFPANSFNRLRSINLKLDLYRACSNFLNEEVPGLPKSMIWKSSLLNFSTYFQKFNLNILKFHLGSKTAILKLKVQIHSQTFYINGEVCLKVGSPRLPDTDYWKSQGSFWESLTLRLPLMQALFIVTP